MSIKVVFPLLGIYCLLLMSFGGYEMSESIYLDTNIYLDYFLDRRGSETAYRILKRALDCEFVLVISDWLLVEMGKYAELNETKTWFNTLKKRNKVLMVSSDEKDLADAKAIDADHFQDPLHAILANKAGAKRLVTHDIRGYVKCRHLVKIVFPEDV